MIMIIAQIVICVCSALAVGVLIPWGGYIIAKGLFLDDEDE